MPKTAEYHASFLSKMNHLTANARKFRQKTGGKIKGRFSHDSYTLVELSRQPGIVVLTNFS